MAEESYFHLAIKLAKKLGIDVSEFEAPHLTDVGNAKLFWRLHGENLRYCHP